MHCLFKGTPLGDWSPSSSVQHHMIPDSDGDAQERVYHLTFFHILYSLLPSPPTCRRWAGITLQLNLSTVKPCVLCVLEGSLPNPGAISPMQPTRPFGTESFPAPHSYILHMESGKCLDSALLPRSLPGSPASQVRSPATGPPQSPWSWASWPEWWGLALGALMAGCQNSPFKAPSLLLLLLLPLRSFRCWDRKS